MKLIVGLGNPGKRYEKTRHNVGYRVLDMFALEISKSEFLNPKKNPNTDFQFQNKFQSLITSNKSLILAKPTTFMNSSGIAVSRLAGFYKIKSTDIYVIHDDLDIKLGEYKVQKGVGPKLHYGISSIEKNLGFSDFWRVRIGVESRDSQNRISGEEFVLQNFSDEEENMLSDVLKKITEDLVGRLQS